MSPTERGSGFKRVEDPTFAKRQGALLLRVSGDIKRNPDFLASEIEVPLSVVKQVLAGGSSVQDREQVINRMVASYPLSRFDLEVVRDDTDEGVVIQSADNSKKSSRVFTRVDRNREQTPYYEYRDAAMSTLGPFRPEWIKELRFVASEDPNDPDIAYNHGHFLNQLTMYIGPVNLHWKDEKGVHTEQMNTGDSNYGTPYVPHSFTTRDSEQETYIMAVTFAGKLNSAVQQELSVLLPEGVSKVLIDSSSKQKAFSGLLKLKAQDSLMTADVLSTLSNINRAKIENFFSGKTFPTIEELEALAGAIGVNARDLYPPTAVDPKEVVVKRAVDKNMWKFPTEKEAHYLIDKLAGSPKVAEVKGFTLITDLDNQIQQESELDLDTPTHTFGYNYGDKPAVLYWQGNNSIRTSKIEPGASFYIKPLVKHALRHEEDPARLMLVRLGGNLSGDSYFELSALPRESIGRLLRETGLWY